MGIEIREKLLKNDRGSLYLDICHHGVREYVFLGIYTCTKKKKTTAEKEYNKLMRGYAEQIKLKKLAERLNNEYGVVIKADTKVDLLAYFRSKLPSEGASKVIFEAALKHLEKYSQKSILLKADISERFLERFYDYLVEKLKGETPHTYFKKIKFLFAKATKDRIFSINPAIDIKGRKFSSRVKETLSEEDLRCLTNTPCSNNTVKYAFLFCCSTGLRFCDVKRLQWKNISNDTLTLIQQKTKKPISQILNPTALHILSSMAKKGEAIFPLPTARGCAGALARWVKKAKIEKKITWHCARHTFGTLLSNQGTDLFITSKLLGHGSIAHTQKYVRENDALKKEAVMRLPQLFTDNK